jgi:hypothetical protein
MKRSATTPLLFPSMPVTSPNPSLLARVVAPESSNANDLHEHTYGNTSDPLIHFSCAFPGDESLVSMTSTPFHLQRNSKTVECLELRVTNTWNRIWVGKDDLHVDTLFPNDSTQSRQIGMWPNASWNGDFGSRDADGSQILQYKRIICFTLPGMANIPSSDGRRLKRVSLPYRPIVMIGTCR